MRYTMKRTLSVALLLVVFCMSSRAFGQPIISYISPDAGAAGMTVAVEIFGSYGPVSFANDGEWYFDLVQLTDLADTNRVVLGPQTVSWSGRLIQFVLFIKPEAQTGVVGLTVKNGLNSVNFTIVDPLDFGALSGNVTLAGESPRNTIVVDSLVLMNGTFKLPRNDVDLNTPGNQAYLPVRILSQGPIRLINAMLDVSGYPGSKNSAGGDGGPGGGGGGGGMPANGGNGYSGGGGVGEQSNHNARHGGEGTGGTRSHYYDGGSGLSGVSGGEGCEHGNPLEGNDEGGGGGTGHPFGKSGLRGVYKTNSQLGGWGGGSGGGTSTTSGTTNYGGGGGGDATKGDPGGGIGDNGGQITGNEVLVPLAGGSGGGSGNVAYGFAGAGGCGGGGGGAIDLTSFTRFEFQSGTITARGGNGSDGSSGLGENGAGGGGGSGGAVAIAARDSILIGSASASPAIDVNGGDRGSSGGNGGLGRVRVDGRVSATTGNPDVSRYFTPGKDYAGPSIQRVTFSDSTFTVYGSSGGLDAGAKKIWLWQSFKSRPGVWTQTSVIPSVTPGVHTTLWKAGPYVRPMTAADTELYLVAAEDNQPGSTGSFADEPAFVFSHVSAIIAKPTRIPASVLNVTTVDFGTIAVGSCKDSFVIVTNSGTAALSVTKETIGDARFTVLDALPITLQAGKSDTLHIRFCPSDTTQTTSNDAIATNAPESPQNVVLIGKGKKGILSVPAVLDFGNVAKGACKDTGMFVYNRGNDSLAITSETLSNPKFTATSPALPVTIGAYDSVLFTFHYCSADTGAERSDGTLTSGETGQFELRAHTSLGSIKADSVVDLGCVIVGRPRQAKAYFRNTGNTAVTGVTATITSGSGLQIVSYPSSDLKAHASDSITVEFDPAAAGNFMGSVHIAWPANISVEGTGADILFTAHVSNPAKLEVLGSSIDFGIVDVDSTRGDSCFEVTNYSCEALTADAFVLSGSSAFRVTSSNLPATLVDSARATVCIAYTPTRNGPDSATIRFVSGRDTSSPVALHGVGLAPIVGVTLVLDTVYGRPGDVVEMHARIVNDVSQAAITSVTFRVIFDPMKLDLRTAFATVPLESAPPVASATIADVARSIGDHEITVTTTEPLTGSGILARLPFEILAPTANEAAVTLLSASFGTARASLSTPAPGAVMIEQCDTTERIALGAKKLDVAQNSPNPFNPRTSVRMDVTTPGFVTLRVFNVLGQEIDRPFAGTLGQGAYTLTIDGGSYPSGTYQYVVDWSDGETRAAPIRHWMTVAK
jgi:hypothetical protein